MLNGRLFLCAACVSLAGGLLAQFSPAAETPKTSTKPAGQPSAAQAAVEDLSSRISRIVDEQADIEVYGLFAAIDAVKVRAADLDDGCRARVIADLGKLLNYEPNGKVKIDSILKEPVPEEADLGMNSKDESAFLRARAAVGLARTGDASVLPLLKSLAEDDKQYWAVRMACRQAMPALQPRLGLPVTRPPAPR